MALKRLPPESEPWMSPIWPVSAPRAKDLRVLYGEDADELVVRFDDVRGSDAVVVLITTPEVDYAGMVVNFQSGAVIGVHVYPLLAFAVQRHPAWRAAADPRTAPEVAARVVADIKDLFDHYGIEPLPDDRA